MQESPLQPKLEPIEQQVSPFSSWQYEFEEESGKLKLPLLVQHVPSGQSNVITWSELTVYDVVSLLTVRRRMAAVERKIFLIDFMLAYLLWGDATSVYVFDVDGV